MTELQVLRAGTVPYEEAWAMQRELHAARVAGGGPDTLLLLEHPSVYTAGRRTEPHERPLDGTPVIDVDRGGKITWHGPGQLVGYPIVALPDPVDVVAHVRRLEQALIDVCADLGLPTGRIDGRSGVWVPADPPGGAGRPARKIAAIGVRVARGVSMHGFALNCDPDLRAFGAIVPCGITDAGVTSLSAELGRDVPVAEVIDRVETAVRRVLASTGAHGAAADPPAATAAPPATVAVPPVAAAAPPATAAMTATAGATTGAAAG
ncbi:lipoyl(octanoyl) transferase LipB [Geodermatophilus sp. YIM 151500]|uniref:lipoyl(octanoyl) transferase LipB n=1 Tax=Geodermatophilus sp. YIM 151500 TaxID=2984531 RepID=UPI0021E36722|nr:lipoyl(octanoyl) transferase LipB [Geodermatophilus sp. YIM 151500]MCV2491298.1 lipoyl(octanoyl) transferase LipB [Geodermatophilus sp. YIM 151500]